MIILQHDKKKNYKRQLSQVKLLSLITITLHQFQTYEKYDLAYYNKVMDNESTNIIMTYITFLSTKSLLKKRKRRRTLTLKEKIRKMGKPQ